MIVSYNIYSLLRKPLTKGVIMKKLILLIALSVLLYSAPGHTAGRGDPEKEMQKAGIDKALGGKAPESAEEAALAVEAARREAEEAAAAEVAEIEAAEPVPPAPPLEEILAAEVEAVRRARLILKAAAVRLARLSLKEGVDRVGLLRQQFQDLYVQGEHLGFVPMTEEGEEFKRAASGKKPTDSGIFSMQGDSAALLAKAQMRCDQEEERCRNLCLEGQEETGSFPLPPAKDSDPEKEEWKNARHRLMDDKFEAYMNLLTLPWEFYRALQEEAQVDFEESAQEDLVKKIAISFVPIMLRHEGKEKMAASAFASILEKEKGGFPSPEEEGAAAAAPTTPVPSAPPAPEEELAE